LKITSEDRCTTSCQKGPVQAKGRPSLSRLVSGKLLARLWQRQYAAACCWLLLLLLHPAAAAQQFGNLRISWGSFSFVLFFT